MQPFNEFPPVLLYVNIRIESDTVDQDIQTQSKPG